MRVAIIGAGTVGTATGVGLAHLGHQIEFVEQSRGRVSELKAEGYTAYRPERLDLNNFDAVVVSVNTPTCEHGIDATDLLNATETIGNKLAESENSPLIIFRCTQPPGTTRNALIPLLQRTSQKKVNEDFGVCYWPEYLRAVKAQDDFDNPRVVTISTPHKHDKSHNMAALIALDLQSAVHWLPLEAAELQKYVNNVGNAIKISTYNWFRLLAEKIGIPTEDINHIFKLCTLSAEGLWNPEYGTQDLGSYQGACLPKDIAALRLFAETAGIDASLLKAAEKINKEINKNQCG